MGMRVFKLVAVALLVLLVAGTGYAKPVLKVGTDPTYEPFENKDDKGNFYGFDIDLMKMIGEELDMEIQFQAVSWDGIIPGLQNGNYDCLISAMTITKERQAMINFSDPYFRAGQLILVRKSNTTIKSEKDLAGKAVAVQNGTTADLEVSKIKATRVKRFGTNPEAILELKNGGADAAVMDDFVARRAAQRNPDLKLVSDEPFTAEYYGIGVRKGNDKLLEMINKALATLKKNGKLDALYDSYFGKGK
ncbi:MAG: basic amino acid ABC transporter substrate-binding protein [Firmicutes bacterium]|nr:basic amino acid ABC transporter substrate-binding protein [Bacillota bacterium]